MRGTSAHAAGPVAPPATFRSSWSCAASGLCSIGPVRRRPSSSAARDDRGNVRVSSAERSEAKVRRGGGGPRQPGGGRQIAGPRHPGRGIRPEASGRPERRSRDADGPRKTRAHGAHAGPSAARGDLRDAPDRPRAAADQGPGTSVQTVAVSADETGMRVDRFLEARFPGLSYSHIQRIIRKGELRVNGRRAQPKQRLEAGQAVRIPPLRLDQPKPRSAGNAADDKTREFLKSITLYED